MTPSIPSLWPEDIIAPSTQVAPVTILRAQASALGQKSGNLVTAEVRTAGTKSGDLSHEFFLIAPPLDFYRYALFTVTHPITEFYPLSLENQRGEREEIQDEDSFVASLRRILASEDIKKVIALLLAQMTQGQ